MERIRGDRRYDLIVFFRSYQLVFYTTKIRIRPFFTKYNVVFVLVQSDSNDYNGVCGQEGHTVHQVVKIE